jgi:hypothetical protein
MSNLAPADVAPSTDTATWCKIIVAAALDVLFAVLIAEYVVGYLGGKASRGAFALAGAPALAVLGAVALYFVVCIRSFGATVWQHALGLRPLAPGHVPDRAGPRALPNVNAGDMLA